MKQPILLSTPHISQQKLKFVQQAFDTNWVAPVGHNIDAFEQEFSQVVGAEYATALSSGTAALYLALKLIGVKLRLEMRYFVLPLPLLPVPAPQRYS
ncbi:MAG TPA: DegT/DnrJ/EryC1/StrS family aminotransferase [Coleofasciculaceae cyanobacterium]